ncbi:hypothetical protein, partial [Methylobacterium sp. J-090]|uniref:hypothetical protein n=1 Tax=Methylobacterium sp. J-090 TaxID=2836666 RepID=UPI001FBBA93F
MCELSSDVPHLTPTLSFQEREPVALHADTFALSTDARPGPSRYPSSRTRGSPLLEGERQGEVCELSRDVPHLTPTLSFQEREPVALHADTFALSTDARPGPNRYPSSRTRGSPLLEGEGQGEVCDISGQVPHLTPTLSFQERGPVALHIDR